MQRNDVSVFRRAALLAFASVLVLASGVLALGYQVVPKGDLAGVVAAVLYVLGANCLEPPSTLPPAVVEREVSPLAKESQLSMVAVRLLLAFSLVLSIIIPWAWIVFFSASDSELALLGPHLFLMMTQVLFEIWSYRTSVNVVIRVGIPVGFVAYRMRVLTVWAQLSLKRDPLSSADRFMRVLSVGNLGFWFIVLFYVLLIKVCPPYFGVCAKTRSGLKE